MMNRVLYEMHSHTPLCKHAVGTPEEYAAVAQQRGLRGIVVTCHNPMPDGFSARVRMREDEFDEYLDLVSRAREVWAGRVDVRLGLEADYFAGYESWLERQLASADFNYVLGSVHPQLDEFRRRYWNDHPAEVQRTYFRLLADAAETNLFDCLAHPDLVKNVTADAWEPDHIMGDIRSALDRIAATGIAMELNTSGVNKVIPEMNPFPAMLVEMRQRGIPVVVGADAHQPGRVADGFETALDLLADCGYTHVSIFLERKRREISIETARASLVAPLPVG
jgi:histidinol-phosphatase (PHP family)